MAEWHFTVTVWQTGLLAMLTAGGPLTLASQEPPSLQTCWVSRCSVPLSELILASCQYFFLIIPVSHQHTVARILSFGHFLSSVAIRFSGSFVTWLIPFRKLKFPLKPHLVVQGGDRSFSALQLSISGASALTSPLLRSRP